MEHLDKLICLSECCDGFIGICECCSNVNLLYKNIAIKLKEEEFEYFRNYLNELNPDDFIIKSRHGRNVFMRTPVKNIVLCFSKYELKELTMLFNEATLMLTAYKILK